MKVTTLNVNGLRSAERRGFRDWLARAAPDVLCLQEIRCEEATAPPGLWAPEGYHAAWSPARQKGYAGTAVWSRRAPVAVRRGTGHPRGDDEGRATGMDLGGLEVWSVYLPSGSSGPERQAWKYAYMAHLEPWLAALLASGRPALVCGDVNIAHQPIDLKNWRGNQKNSGFLPEERAWFGARLAEGWRDAFRERHPELAAYSWWSNRGRARENDVGWRIDYVLATPSVRVVDAGIDRHAGLSDHAPVWVELEVG